MKVNKKQVRGMLKVLKNKTTKQRINLQYLSLKDGTITITDGFQLYQFKSELTHDGQCHYTEIERWYKLHSAKDNLELDTLEFKDCEINYPGLYRIMDSIPYKEIESITLNADFISTATLILNVDNITLNFTGQHSKIEVSDNENIKGLILPVRKQ